MKVLAVDCCPRGESATRKLFMRYLSAMYSEESIEFLNLYGESLAPLRESDVMRRTALVDSGALDDGMLRYAVQFRDADEIVVAAPYWDLSFPSMLKVYLEHVSVSGVTFGYTREGKSEGYCRAGRLIYLSTCGGYIHGAHLGAAYVDSLAKMLGIPITLEYHIEGLDIDPSMRDALVSDGITRVLRRLS